MKKVKITLQDGKEIRLKLYEEYAPITVANFLHLVDIHFYDGLIFHRIIKGFMSQGGAYYVDNGQLKTKPLGYTIPGEFTANGFNNQLSHTAGVISMARTNDYNSGSSQFFICDEDSEFLNNNYAAFGIVADQESLDVVHAISSIPTSTLGGGLADFPNVANIREVTISTISIVE